MVQSLSLRNEMKYYLMTEIQLPLCTCKTWFGVVMFTNQSCRPPSRREVTSTAFYNRLDPLGQQLVHSCDLNNKNLLRCLPV
jgi:hypothetical protein